MSAKRGWYHDEHSQSRAVTEAVSGITHVQHQRYQRDPPALTGWSAAGAQVEPGSVAVCAALLLFYRALQTTQMLAVGPRR